MDSEFAGAVTEFQNKMAQVAQVQDECAQLVATGWARRRAVRVTVNADGVAIDIKFGAGANELTHDELAAAVTEASQQAVRDVAAQVRKVVAPLTTDRVAAPGLADLLGAVDSLREQLH